jgi:hypothetical protein
MRVRQEVSTILSCLSLLLLVSTNHLSLVSGLNDTTPEPSSSPVTVDFGDAVTAEPTDVDVDVDVVVNITVNVDVNASIGVNASLAPTDVPTSPSPSSTPTASPTTMPTTMPTAMPSASGKPSLSLAPSSMPMTVTVTMTPSLSPTTSPSQTPTEAPVTVTVTTGRPTPVPSIAPSASPTATPTSIPVVPVEGRLDLTLAPVASLLTSTTRTTFLEAITAFLYQQLPLLQQDSLIVQLVGQSLAQRRRRLLQQQQRQQQQLKHQKRHLQTETLVLDLKVTGLLYGLNTTLTGNFQDLLEQTFQDNVAEFLDTLQETPDPYFDTITDVSIPSAAPVFSPTAAPDSSNADAESPTDDDDNDDDSFFSLGVIIGIAVGGGVLVLIMLFIVYRAVRRSKAAAKASSNPSFPSEPVLAGNSHGHGHGQDSPRKHKSWMQKRAESQSRKEGQDAASDLLENQTLYSYKDNASFAMGAPNHFDTDTLAGADTMSYAYSLEAGIEPSVMDVDMGMDMDMGGGGAEEGSLTQPQSSPLSSSRIQIPSEIPAMVPHKIGTNSQQRHNTERPSSSHLSSTSSGAGAGGDPSEFGVDPAVNLNSPTGSDLELTQSELAMLPNHMNLNLATTNTNTTSSDDHLITTRQVYAPPGKLGLVIDTTVEGPVVHKVNSGSTLEQQIWPGDIIVAIDDVDTRAMSASAITQLMVQTAKQRRKLTIVSGEA